MSLLKVSFAKKSLLFMLVLLLMDLGGCHTEKFCYGNFYIHKKLVDKQKQSFQQVPRFIYFGPLEEWSILEVLQTQKSLFFQLLIILCMGNFGNRANFRLPVFSGFPRFGVWRIQKTQNQNGVRKSVSLQVSMLVCFLIYQSVETIFF